MHPVGPRTSGVYWFRRLLVGALALAVVAGVVWFVVRKADSSKVDTAAETSTTSGAMTGVLATSSQPPDTSQATVAAQTSVASSTSKAATTSAAGSASKAATSAKAASTSQAAATTTTPATTKATATSNTKAATTSKATTSAKATTTPVRSSAKPATTKTTKTTPKATTPTTTPKPTTPPPPSTDAQGRLICSDAAISVVATTGSPTFPVGSQPLLGLTVTNVGSVPCVRDLSGPLQVFTVHTAQGKRVWSTADCFPGTGTDVRMLAPGGTVSYTIRWSGTNSQPGCTGQRTAVPAGNYTLTAAVGTATSKPKAFSITG